MINFFTENTKRQAEKGNGFRFQPTDGNCVGKAVTTRAGGRMDDNFIEEPIRLGNIYGEHCGTGFAGNVWDKGAISPALMTMQGGNRQPMIVAEPIAYDEQNRYIRKDGCVGTLTTDGSSPKHNNRVIENARIRKLTPKECWRLMGFDDEDFEKAEKVNSNTQLYKQAGNSIVVDVLYYIFREML